MTIEISVPIVAIGSDVTICDTEGSIVQARHSEHRETGKPDGHVYIDAITRQAQRQVPFTVDLAEVFQAAETLDQKVSLGTAFTEPWDLHLKIRRMTPWAAKDYKERQAGNMPDLTRLLNIHRWTPARGGIFMEMLNYHPQNTFPAFRRLLRHCMDPEKIAALDLDYHGIIKDVLMDGNYHEKVFLLLESYAIDPRPQKHASSARVSMPDTIVQRDPLNVRFRLDSITEKRSLPNRMIPNPPAHACETQQIQGHTDQGVIEYEVPWLTLPEGATGNSIFRSGLYSNRRGSLSIRFQIMDPADAKEEMMLLYETYQKLIRTGDGCAIQQQVDRLNRYFLCSGLRSKYWLAGEEPPQHILRLSNLATERYGDNRLVADHLAVLDRKIEFPLDEDATQRLAGLAVQRPAQMPVLRVDALSVEDTYGSIVKRAYQLLERVH